MKTIETDFGNWYVRCIPEDGARISVLRYEGKDLLTPQPDSFKPPEKSYGKYETRPVYGYDDCFPTVDSCIYPEEQFECSDHGELCWQQWSVITKGNCLVCTTNCLKPKVTFKRTLEFSGNQLIWRFEVTNGSAKNIPFIHVMHPLLPLEEIQTIILPDFGNIEDEINMVEPDLKNGREVAGHLLAVESGIYEMLLLKELTKGSLKLDFRNGLSLNINYDIKLYPTLGIWWNNTGYPAEKGLFRTECAFEPISGSSSNLAIAFTEGSFLEVEPGKSLMWKVIWKIKV